MEYRMDCKDSHLRSLFILIPASKRVKKTKEPRKEGLTFVCHLVNELGGCMGVSGRCKQTLTALQALYIH